MSLSTRMLACRTETELRALLERPGFKRIGAALQKRDSHSYLWIKQARDYHLQRVRAAARQAQGSLL